MKPIKSIFLVISFFLLISCDKNDEGLLPDIEPNQ